MASDFSIPSVQEGKALTIGCGAQTKSFNVSQGQRKNWLLSCYLHKRRHVAIKQVQLLSEVWKEVGILPSSHL